MFHFWNMAKNELTTGSIKMKFPDHGLYLSIIFPFPPIRHEFHKLNISLLKIEIPHSVIVNFPRLTILFLLLLVIFFHYIQFFS